MKTFTHRFIWILSLMTFAGSLSAQSVLGGNTFITVLGVVVILITLFVLAQLADSLLQVEASKQGLDGSKHKVSIIPSWQDLFGSRKPGYVGNNLMFSLHRGYNIKLRGVPARELKDASSNRYAIQPPNFRGIAPIPKLMVEIGQSVKAGDPIFFDKSNPDILYVAPVSGEVVEVNRGAKRAITEVVILADKEQQHKKFTAPELGKASREDLVKFLTSSGAWPLIIQRPFDIVPDVNEVPDNIFISTFSTAPLAADRGFLLQGKEADFHKGLEVLTALTSGKVYLGLSANDKEAPAKVFTDAAAEKVYFKGPHPAGNVGIQMHHISPIGAKGMVWTVGVQDVATIGSLFTKGIFDSSRILALSGAPFTKPSYIRTNLGANVGEVTSGMLDNEKIRYVSGDVLSGHEKSADQYVDWRSEQITTLKEGDYYEMFGWLLALKPRPSISHTYPTAFIPGISYEADTNTHGEKRAFVVTGQYESVLPMDIYPQQLFKSIVMKDIEQMEGLGIKELSEEDVALCEFVCTSKQPLQHLLREGLDIIEEQS